MSDLSKNSKGYCWNEELAEWQRIGTAGPFFLFLEHSHLHMILASPQDKRSSGMGSSGATSF